MKLNKKQEKAVNIAIDVMGAILEHGQNDAEGQIDFAIKELLSMRNKSNETKARENSKKAYLKNLLQNTSTVTLDGKWYDENVRKR